MRRRKAHVDEWVDERDHQRSRDLAREQGPLALDERFSETLDARACRVQRGRFGARMDVMLVDDGRVTIVPDRSPEWSCSHR